MPEPILKTPVPTGDPLPAEDSASLALLIKQADLVLSASLAQSNLPAVTMDRIYRQFAGQVFQMATLTAEIEAARAEVASLTAANLVKGPARIAGVTSSSDQVKAAVDDLLGAPREPGQEQRTTRTPFRHTGALSPGHR